MAETRTNGGDNTASQMRLTAMKHLTCGTTDESGDGELESPPGGNVYNNLVGLLWGAP